MSNLLKTRFSVVSYILLGFFLLSHKCQANYEYDPYQHHHHYYPQNASRWDNYFDHSDNNYNYPSDNQTYRTIIPTNYKTPVVVTDTEAFEYSLRPHGHDQDTESEIPHPLDANSYSKSAPDIPTAQQYYQPDYNTNHFYRNYPSQNENTIMEPYEPDKYQYHYQPASVAPTETVLVDDPVTNHYKYGTVPQYNRIPEVVNIPVKEKSFRKIQYRSPKIKPPPFQFPSSPLPGWSGIYSPNPGYLVKQNFQVYRPPIYIPPRQKSLSSIWHKAIG